MPTQVDIQLSTVRNGIAESIQAIQVNILTKNLSTAVDVDNQNPSPLFRDELHMHEMRYLDTFLSPAQNNVADGKNSSSLSPVDSLMSALDHIPDSDMATQTTTLPKGCTLDNHSQKQNTTSEARRYHQNNIATSRRYSHSSHSHHHDNNKPENYLKNPKAAHDKTYSKCPTPSMTKRRQFHRRFMQQARIKSRKLARKMIELASFWTRNESNLTRMIRKSVEIAVRKVQIVLEQSKRGDGVSCQEMSIDLMTRLRLVWNQAALRRFFQLLILGHL
jgi:hypothetical protein